MNSFSETGIACEVNGEKKHKTSRFMLLCRLRGTCADARYQTI